MGNDIKWTRGDDDDPKPIDPVDPNTDQKPKVITENDNESKILKIGVDTFIFST